MTVRTRFAPSPTGALHVGGARTAAFNYFFAKQQGGQFFLRMEDTDKERSKQEYVSDIILGLRWLGIQWDGEIVYQSKRTQLYEDFLCTLIHDGLVYKDYTPASRLEELRKEAEEAKRPFVYRQSRVSPEEQYAFKKANLPFVYRFAVPDGVEVKWNDVVYGEITHNTNDIGDFVCFRGDGSPVFHIVNMLDDIEMGITHVIRGTDHISNTARQLLLYGVLNSDPPVFAHIPLIHGPDGQKLSKKHGATNVLQYGRDGFLPDAMLNYIMLMGWSMPADEDGATQEVLSRDEIVQNFALDRIHKSAAVFDTTKMTWMNGVYIRQLPKEKILPTLREQLRTAYSITGRSREWLDAAIELEIPRCKLMTEFAPALKFLFVAPESYDDKTARKLLCDTERRMMFDLALKLIEQTEFGFGTEQKAHDSLQQKLRDHAEHWHVKFGDIMQALRVAITGTTVSPPLFEVMDLLGREETARRLRVYQERLPELV